MLKYIKGDATLPIETKTHRIICHCCNNIGKWGKGFVIALGNRYPISELTYTMWMRGTDFHGQKHAWPKPFALGNTVVVRVSPPTVSSMIYVANMIGQDGIYPKNGVPPIRYDALESCFEQLFEFIKKKEQQTSVHMPRIGCGLAGGLWSSVEPIIQRSLVDRGIDVYVYDLE